MILEQNIFGENPRVSVDGGTKWYRGRFQHSLGTELLCQAPATAAFAGVQWTTFCATISSFSTIDLYDTSGILSWI